MMGDVIVAFRVIPEDIDNFEEVKRGLTSLRPQKLEEEPIAFGLKALIFTKIIPDKEGELPKIEEEIQRIKHVKTCETVSISRSL
jgi:translation elongation factor aEF-1 beta